MSRCALYLVIISMLASAQARPTQRQPWFRSEIEPVLPIESLHKRALNGVEAWTLSYVLKDHSQGAEPEPLELVITQRGRVVRTLQNGPFYWNFGFLDGGAKMVIEHGPRHFVMAYDLVDPLSGKVLSQWNTDNPEKAPAWVTTLTR